MAEGHPASECHRSHICSAGPVLGSKFTARLVQRTVGLWVTGRGQTAGCDWWAVRVETSLPAETSTCGDGQMQVGWSIVAKYHQKSLESAVT